MQLRLKKDGSLCTSGRFNIHSLSEIIVGFPEGDMDSMDIRDFDVRLPDGSWKDLGQAFKDHDVVPDNYNTSFCYPVNEEARQRGWNP